MDDGLPTVEDHGDEAKDWIDLFEVVENRSELEGTGIIERIEEGSYVTGGKEVPTGTGSEEVYEMKDGGGYLILRWGPYQINDGHMFEGSVNIAKDFEGGHKFEGEKDPIDEKYDELLENKSAPYLEQLNMNEMGGLAAVTVPYD